MSGTETLCFSRPLKLTNSLGEAYPKNGVGWTLSLGGWTDRYLGYLTMGLLLHILRYDEEGNFGLS